MIRYLQWCCGYKERNIDKKKTYKYPDDIFFDKNRPPISSFNEIPDIILKNVEYCGTCKKDLDKAEHITKYGSSIFHFCGNKCYEKWLEPSYIKESNA